MQENIHFQGQYRKDSGETALIKATEKKDMALTKAREQVHKKTARIMTSEDSEVGGRISAFIRANADIGEGENTLISVSKCKKQQNKKH